ncbi:thioredoxin family protein [Neptunomonas antarctica]|uniref:Thioredoxin-related protein n=1 Tax=Neptunomonas antarctica TaxID=619304 RepID=A0A1N7KKQ0_9GAMM|nr:thioredoxin fold domain-containing protein [Neptunomonas antarctica]SIS62165.1 Thioredoxin-related protein [Neptunomonas antarctica]
MISRHLLSYVSGLILSGVFSIAASTAHASDLPVTTSLLQDANALGSNRVLVVMLSQQDCSYCQLIRHDFLEPMHRGGLYQKKALFRELKTDSNQLITDFDGTQISPQSFARRYKATLIPTLLFLNNSGKAIVPNSVGISTPEFYGYYLDQSIDDAIAQLNID